jgi:hypothetical protein
MSAVPPNAEVNSEAMGCLGDLPVQPCSQKYFCFLLTQITGLFGPSHSSRGALAIVTNVGMGCGGRGCAIDEQR